MRLPMGLRCHVDYYEEQIDGGIVMYLSKLFRNCHSKSRKKLTVLP